ncbi:peptide ABC transporter substrate-binding protein [Oleiphilus sp. HI0081]|nr:MULTISPECIES: DUF1302 domain-containing protein [unclassified Oleiphilus]KZY75176.1 peptide ABC transporter substrate-binding protein [Oleiphilus sp. HI0068]KZY76570.1 peptide ABC transporter substrate-binding protein [Oleiphilus sp. HI0069]KZY90095.1 peptide ABC transporter substrate-binding protein [Oleiphilus sp. HI0072]KZZ10210.1 peptide ABC transporter substrate-binding protein [Oleiphilus sp. HI0078]KZZ30320.1 peptide ABC transporter substrate-binding protein [Oleiphilus sp. HI0081]
MTKKTQRLHKFAKLPLAAAVAATLSAPASAFQFYMGDIEASFDTNISAGSSWRVEGRDDRLIGTGNGGSGFSINTDDGNLNFDKGDAYSQIVKGTSDFLATYEDWGVFARAKYWYDFELKDGDRDTDVNGYQRQLSKNGKANASGGEILDAYIWRDFWFGDTPLNLRLGKQVVSWGESTFIFNGINVINPVDIGAIRAPGAEIKEALIPVNMLYGSLGLTDDITIEAFIQLEYEPSRIDDCGTYFSTNDYVADGCGPVWGANFMTEEWNQGGQTGLQRMYDDKPDDTDQFGIALRWFAADLNETEFGFYFLQYHSRLPIVGGRVGTDVDSDGAIDSDEQFSTAEYQIQYPEQIQMVGLSFNTTGPGGISLGGEYSFKHDMPLQFNSPDLVLATRGNVVSPIVTSRATDSNGDGTITSDELAPLYGSVQAGYDAYDVSQIQMTAIKFVDQIWGASRLAFVGEVGATYVHNLPDTDEIRYGRTDQLGYGQLTDDLVGELTCQGVLASSNPTYTGPCDDEGYVTGFSWGYRMRTSLQYNDVFAGVNMTPQVAWSHDVKGYAPGPGANFIEGRKSLGLSVRADYLNQYSATLAYTNYFGGGVHNTISDRDSLALSVSYSF